MSSAEVAKRPSAEERFNQELIQEVIEAVRDNNAPWQKSWDSASMAIPYNAQTQRFYSGRNLIRLAVKAQKLGYEDPRWATYNQIRGLGGQVLRGEKGTGILFFKEERLLTEEHAEQPEKVRTARVLRHSTVFNLAQTDLPRYEQQDLRTITPDLQQFSALLERHQPRIVQGEPAYAYASDTIYMPPKAAFHSDAHYYATVLHEMAHWTGHHSRLQRNLGGKFGSPAYAQEEMVAELSSYLLSLQTGLPFEPKSSFSYLQNWSAKTGLSLEESLLQAFRDASAIQGFLLEKPREIVISEQIHHGRDDGHGSIISEVDAQTFVQSVMRSEISVEKARNQLSLKEKTWLAVPYEKRQIARNEGAIWSREHNCWYVDDLAAHPALERFLPQQISHSGGKSLDDFRIAAMSLGLDMPGTMEIGKRYRVALQNRASKEKDGEFKIFANADGTTGAYAINYATGEKLTWSDRGHTVLPKEAYQAVKAAQQQAGEIAMLIDRHIRNQRGLLATQSYMKLPPVRGDEPYITKKNIKIFTGLKRLADGSVVVPLVDGKQITSLQVIAPNGDKRMMKQAGKQGSYFPFGNRRNPEYIFIAEGVATADAVYQIMAALYPKDKLLVVAAIDANNLMPVTESLLTKYPDKLCCIMADNDCHLTLKNKSNIGVEKAAAIAKQYPEVNMLIPPAISPADKEHGIDWNDCLNRHGMNNTIKAIKEQLTTLDLDQAKVTTRHTASFIQPEHRSAVQPNKQIRDGFSR